MFGVFAVFTSSLLVYVYLLRDAGGFGTLAAVALAVVTCWLYGERRDRKRRQT